MGERSQNSSPKPGMSMLDALGERSRGRLIERCGTRSSIPDCPLRYVSVLPPIVKVPGMVGEAGNRGRDSAIAVAVIGAVGVVTAALIQSCGGSGASEPPKSPWPSVVTTAASAPASPTASVPASTASPASAVAYPAADPAVVPALDCAKMTLRVDQVAGVKAPIKTGVSLDVTGSDLWPGDPRQLWLFISGGSVSGLYPSVIAAQRRSGGWRIDGVLLGRPGHPEDAKVELRYLHVTLLPAPVGDALQKSIDGDTFDWINGLPRLPDGHVEVARLPLDRVC